MDDTQPPTPTDPIEPAARALRAGDTQRRSFRIRMIRFDRPESRSLMIRSNSEAGARAQAQSRVGRDWRIARIEAV